jgi:hypothetical protein
MRVKLRPDAHYAPVPQGMYWSRAGRSFALAGPPALYQLVDGSLGRLSRGTSLDELVRDVGNEAARPILRRVLERLVREDILLDLDALTVPAPDPATAHRFGEVIAFLESHCRDPYRVFAKLRGASAAVAGGGPAAEVAARTLRSYGVQDVRHGERYTPEMRECRITLVIDDVDAPLEPPPDPAAAGPAAAEGSLIPVYAGAGFALVGPPGAPGAHRAEVRARIESWLDAGPDGPAPRPLSAVLAGSLAAHAALVLLTGVGERPQATTLVHGRLLRTRQLTISPAEIEPADCWELIPDPLTQIGDDEPAEGDAPSAAETQESVAAFSQPWIGPVGRGSDAELVQMPLSLATAELRDSRRRVAGWGENRAEATLDALLAAARELATRELAARELATRGTAGPEAAGVSRAEGAAGASYAGWLLDGALRCLAKDAVSRTSPDPVDRAGLADSAQRSLWSVCEDYFQRRLHAALYRFPGLDWCLAAAEDSDGELRACAWGPDAPAAMRAALAAAAAAAQADPDIRSLLADAGPATGLVERLPAAAVRSALRQVEKLLADEGRRLVAAARRADTVLGEMPLCCGLVWVS